MLLKQQLSWHTQALQAILRSKHAEKIPRGDLGMLLKEQLIIGIHKLYRRF